MGDKRFIVLETVEVMSREQGCVYIEKTSFGAVVIVNLFNFEEENQYLICLTDADGHTNVQKFNSNYVSFSLGGFSVNDDIYVEVYKNDHLSLKGFSPYAQKNEFCDLLQNTKNDFDDNRLTAEEYAKETNQTRILEEAKSVLNKYKNSSKLIETEEKPQEKICDGSKIGVSNSETNEDFTNQNPQSDSFYSSIKDEFEMLFDGGEQFTLFEERFGGCWRRIEKSETLILAKFYNKPKFLINKGAMPDIIAIAMPVIVGKNEQQLGKNSLVYTLQNSNDFAYNILFQYASDGRAIKFNCN